MKDFGPEASNSGVSVIYEVQTSEKNKFKLRTLFMLVAVGMIKYTKTT